METEYYKIKRRSDGKFFTCSWYAGGWKTDFDEIGDFLTMETLEFCFEMAIGLKELYLFHDCHVIQYKLVENNDSINEGQLRFERIMFEEI